MARKKQARRTYDILPNNWCNYPGNKKKIIEHVLDFIPNSTGTFVDVFGGTGFVSANAYKNQLVENVILNEFEFDQAELLAFLADNKPEDVIKYYKAAFKHWFPESEHETLTREQLPQWKKLVNYYNSHKVRFDETKEDYQRRKNEVQMGLQLVKTNTLSMDEWKEARKRNNPYILLLLLIRNCKMGTPRWRDDGRRFEQSPQTDSPRDIEKIKPFLDTWHTMYEHDALKIYSHNFVDIYIPDYPHKRPRPAGAANGRILKLDPKEIRTTMQPQEQFVGLVSELGSGDFVYLDPPYLNSSAQYNANWTASMEIQLLTLLELLTKLEIPYLLNNNLMYGNSLLATWCDAERYHARTPKKSVYVLDKGYFGRKGLEVFVTNRTDIKPNQLSDNMRKIPKTQSVLDLIN